MRQLMVGCWPVESHTFRALQDPWLDEAISTTAEHSVAPPPLCPAKCVLGVHW
jgi:hypothetical protein